MAEEEGVSVREDTPATAAASVADALADMVLGRMAPGTSIPSEAELAVRFAVSRLTVREAVKMLAGRGLLQVGRGRRAVVSEPDSSGFSDFLMSAIRNDPKGLFDLIELRQMLEVQAASLAAKRASRAGLLAIETAMQSMRDALARLATGATEADIEVEFTRADVQFHEAVATASGNRIVAHVYEAMSQPLRESFRLSRQAQLVRGAGSEETVAAHEAILEAIRAGNARAAGEAMRKHLQSTEIDVRSHLSGAGAAEQG